jgi:hypothetical protein
MSANAVQLIGRRFLNDPTPEVLSIKGAWGSGKTFTWNKVLKENKNANGLQKYSYVSLFGISSINELALSIYTKTKELRKIDHKDNLSNTLKKWIPSLKNLANFSIVNNVSIALEKIAFHLIKDTIICLDDLERNHSLKADEILGFISSLKEEMNCKIILIFNDEKLEEIKEKYHEYREKVIDIELNFKLSPMEAASAAFPNNIDSRDEIIDRVLVLNITNIRVLKKILWVINLLMPHIKNLHNEVRTQTISSVVLLTWAHYSNEEIIPTIDFILNWNKEMFNEKKDKNQLLWTSILRNYGFTYIDEFDLAIYESIKNGYIDENKFQQKAKECDSLFKANDLENSFSEAWDLFHGSFKNNTEELCVALIHAIKRAYKQISPSNLNSTVRLLRKLGHDDFADEAIKFYVDKRIDEINLFDLKNYPFSDDIDDIKIIESFKLAYKQHKKNLFLIDVIRNISKNNGWNDDDIEVFSQASVNEFYKIFTKANQKELNKIINTCLKFRDIAGFEKLSKNPIEALKKIAEDSEINKLRIIKYGIKLD